MNPSFPTLRSSDLFNRMLRKIIEADQLPEYTMTMTKTVEGAPAVLFELRGAAEAAELHARLEAERERHERYEARSEENRSELQSLMRISYAVFWLKKKT